MKTLTLQVVAEYPDDEDEMDLISEIEQTGALGPDAQITVSITEMEGDDDAEA